MSANEQCEVLCLDLDKAEALRRNRLPVAEAERLAGQAKAVADPTRLMLAAALAEAGELCVCDLAWIAERAENLVSHHLRLLRERQLVSSRRDGKMVLYSLSERGLELVRVTLAEKIAA